MMSGPAYSMMKTVLQAIWAPETRQYQACFLSCCEHTKALDLYYAPIAQSYAFDRDAFVIRDRLAIFGFCYA